jgi:hypothetical protein
VPPGTVQSSAYDAEIDEVFLSALSKALRSGQTLSPNRGPNYAPTVLAKTPSGKKWGKAALESAMHRLLEEGKIHVEHYGPPSKIRSRLVFGSTPRRQCVRTPMEPESGAEPPFGGHQGVWGVGTHTRWKECWNALS